MKNKKAISKWIPEIYLICSVIYYWIDTGLFNPVAIAFIFALILQLIVRNKITGMLISGFFVIINLYATLVLLSDLLKVYKEIGTLVEAKALLFFGSLYMGLNITMGIIMFIKYTKSKNQSLTQVTV